MKLTNSKQVETEVRERKMGLKNVNNRKEEWTPVMRRRKKNSTSESGDGFELDVHSCQLS